MAGAGANVAPVLEQAAARLAALTILIVYPDPETEHGELMAGKALDGTTWYWFRVSGVREGSRRANTCDPVRKIAEKTVKKLEAALNDGLSLVPCFVSGELKALLVAL